MLTFNSDAVGGPVTLEFTAYGDQTHVYLDNVVVSPYEPTPAPNGSWGRLKALYR
jgi:hypothetical protein